MKVLNEFPGSHHYVEEYLPEEDMFCPNCGMKTVWLETSRGDYYCGPDYVCLSCSHTFLMQGPSAMTGENQKRILDQLRSGVMSVPTTKRGG